MSKPFLRETRQALLIVPQTASTPEDPLTLYASKTIDQCLSALQTRWSGLTTQEAADRIEHGPQSQPLSKPKLLLGAVKQMSTLLYLATAISLPLRINGKPPWLL